MASTEPVHLWQEFEALPRTARLLELGLKGLARRFEVEEPQEEDLEPLLRLVRELRETVEGLRERCAGKRVVEFTPGTSGEGRA